MPITSSSISSSEAAGSRREASSWREGPSWRRFVLAFAAGTILVFAGLLGFVVAVDPYDTGRLALLKAPGVPAQIPRTAHASRGRDPAYDAAVLGNSHVQILAPEELTRETGIPFLSLAVPGIGPRETFLLLDYFLRHRVRPARAIVLGIDPYWCRDDPGMPSWLPFPFWLYERSLWGYLVGIVRDQSLDDSFKRLFYAFHLSKRVRARPDGLWDYDETFVWNPERHGPMFRAPAPSGLLNETGRFPAIEALGRTLDALPKDLAVVLLLPPVHAVALPLPGTALARSEAACRTALAEMAKGRPSVAIVDWRVDRPELHVPENFIDPTHYRRPVAREIERDVAAAIGGIEARLKAPSGAGR